MDKDKDKDKDKDPKRPSFSLAEKLLGKVGGPKPPPPKPASQDLVGKIVDAMKQWDSAQPKEPPEGYDLIFDDRPGKALRLGSSGRSVAALGRALRQAGVKEAPESETFDAAMDAVVRRFQRQHGCDFEKGIVGPHTMIALDQALGLQPKKRAGVAPPIGGPVGGGGPAVSVDVSPGGRGGALRFDVTPQGGTPPSYPPGGGRGAVAPPRAAPPPVAPIPRPGAAPRADASEGGLAPTGNAFIDGIIPGAIRGMLETGVPASVTIAQAVLESAWGTSPNAKDLHNLFGTKDETGEGYRRYASDAESAADHARRLAAAEKYGPLLAVAHNAERFAQELTGLYSENPNYGATLVRIMRQYDLFRFDRPMGG